MTHFAEAGFYFHNDGVWASASVHECITAILHQDDAARQAFKSWKEVLGWFLVKNATVTRPVIMPLAILPRGDRQASTESGKKGGSIILSQKKKKNPNSSSGGVLYMKYISCYLSVATSLETPEHAP